MISLKVVGEPAPKGSGRAMLIGGRAVHVPSGSGVNRAKLSSWRDAVIGACAAVKDGDRLLTGAVAISTVFRFPLRKGDLLNGHVRATAPAYHTTKPDADKLERATWDAITASGVWRDDSQVAHSLKTKCYVAPGEWLGAQIAIAPLELPERHVENPLRDLHHLHAGAVLGAYGTLRMAILNAPTRKKRTAPAPMPSRAPVFDEGGGEW